jgi:sporulation protein YlmC with PRC-barrel domain
MFIRSIALASTAVLALATPLLAQTTSPSMPAPVTAPSPVTDLFFTDAWVPTHWRSSEAIGQPVYNRAGERIGEVDELLVDGSGRVLAAVIGVGGFLGMGERKVAVSYRSFQMTREANGKARLVADLNMANLKSAPEYKPVDAAKRS